MNRYEASERGSEWFANESLDFRGKLRPAFGLVFDGSYRSLVIYENQKLSASILRNVGTMHAGASLVLFERVRVGLDLPIVVFQDSGSGTASFQGVTFAPPAEQTLGDLRIGSDVRLVGDYAQTGHAVELALGLQMFLPTGSQADYASDGRVRFAPRVMLAGTEGPFTYAARMGFMLNRNETSIAGAPWGQEFNFGLAAGLRLFEGHLTIGPELLSSVLIASGVTTQKKEIPVEALLGAHATIGSFRFGAGIGGGLSHDIGSPALRWLTSLEIVMPFVLDTDKDGVTDDVDACPVVPGLAELKGCPPDRDRDTVPDAQDACPDVPGPRESAGCPPDRDQDGVYDMDDACVGDPGPKENKGCPPDKDADGLWDKDDACPDVAGPKENKGCPPDKDGDSIPDDADACPDEKGVASPKKELSGCPADMDKDGIVNESDACPKEAGVASADPGKNGCPLASVQGSEIKILQQVQFKLDSAEIVKGPASEDVLNAVLEILKAHPEIKKVSIEGHTDNQGKKAHNKELSTKRAAAVMKWLVDKGIAKERLSSKGWGDEKPLESNSSEEGRTRNRRVEFHITEREEPKP